MEGHYSTGQSALRAVEPMEDDEEEVINSSSTLTVYHSVVTSLMLSMIMQYFL